jgi:hypothetical protein
MHIADCRLLIRSGQCRLSIDEYCRTLIANADSAIRAIRQSAIFSTQQSDFEQ